MSNQVWIAPSFSTMAVPPVSMPLPGVDTGQSAHQHIHYQGEMITVQQSWSLEEFERIGETFIKGKMDNLLWSQIIGHKFIEYTKELTPNTMDRVMVRARIYLLPDNQVRVMRLNGVK